MHEPSRIAVLEDNPPLREELLDLLSDQGWQAVGFCLAADFMRAHQAIAFDVVLLDLGLPDADGIEVAQQLSQQQDSIGIIILSARSSLDDRVRGLVEGADAYVGKPFEHAEVLGYIIALLRRKRPSRTEEAWCLRPSCMQLLSPDGRISVLLTVPELRLVRALIGRAHV